MIIVLIPSHDSASHVQLLKKIMTSFPAEHWLIIGNHACVKFSEVALDIALAGDTGRWVFRAHK